MRGLGILLRLLFVFQSLAISASAKPQINLDSLRHIISLQAGDTAEVLALNRLAGSYYQSDEDSTQILAEQALALAKTIGYDKGRGYAFHHLGTYYFYRSEFDSALTYYRKSLKIKRALGDSNAVSGTLNNMAAIMLKRGQYVEALNANQQSLKLKLLLGDSARASRSLNNIGLIYAKQQNIKLAIQYYNKALNMKKAMLDVKGQASTLTNIGLLHMEDGNYEEALLVHQRAYQIYDSLNLKCPILVTALNLGETYQHLNRKDTAIRYLQLAYSESLECDNQIILCLSLLDIGVIHHEMGLDRQAEKEMLAAYEIAHSHEFKEESHRIASKLYSLYKSLNDPANALKYLEISREIQDEMFNEDMTEEITRLELNYKFEQERDSLEFQKQAELLSVNAKLNEQRLLQYMTLFGLLIALTLAGIIYKYYRSSQHAKHALSETLGEREVLLREIHHRVKNNLQVVSSLLNVQSKYLNDELAKKAVLEGRNRVQSMAMVHEKLYQSDNLSNINVKEYLEELANALFESYNIAEQRVKFSSKIEPVNLSIDTTIQIGLIINELVSNALKYAFPENQNGKVILSLRHAGEYYELEVSDDGVGIASSDDLLKSYGYRIVRSISRGLNGKISMQHQKGTSFRLTF